MSEMDDQGIALDEADGQDGLAEQGLETPEADAMEQYTLANGPVGYRHTEVPLEVDPADAAEQDRVVELDDDDYR